MLWVVGFDVGPGLHVAAHEWLGHHHHGSSSHVAVAEEAHGHEHGGHEHGGHEHGDHGHEHDAHEHEHEHDAHEHDAHDEHDALAAADDDVEFVEPVVGKDALLVADAEAVAQCADDFGHGAHSLAHRGVAAFPTPPAWPSVAVATWTPLTRAERSFDPVRSRAPQCARARGPPV